MGTKGSWFIFVLFIGALRYAFLFVDPQQAWNYTFISYSLIQLYLMHWVKGTMDRSDQGQFMDQTWWEQIDGGKLLWFAHRTNAFVVAFLVTFVLLCLRNSVDENPQVPCLSEPCPFPRSFKRQRLQRTRHDHQRRSLPCSDSCETS